MKDPGFSREVRGMRSATTVFFSILVIIFIYFTIVLIESGNVGVRKTLGKINPEEATPGLNLKLPMVTQITEFVGKEIAIDLTDLTPKAADNLSLRDMDVTVFYKADNTQISDLYVKYANAHQYDVESDSYFPAYRLVLREARRAAYETVAEIERKNAEIEAIRAQGIANANDIINKTLTSEHLQHELNLTLQKFAETGANTIVVPANMQGFDMILPTDKLTKN
jgi:regulator of protease activity HflC (stomatin/prohibitin superfamily)